MDFCTRLVEVRTGIDSDLAVLIRRLKSIAPEARPAAAETVELNCRMERTSYIVRNNSGSWKGKVGGPLVVARKGGLTFTLAQMNYWFLTLEFYIPGVRTWDIAVGRNKGEVANNKEGMEAAWKLGKSMAFLMKAVRTWPQLTPSRSQFLLVRLCLEESACVCTTDSCHTLTGTYGRRCGASPVCLKDSSGPL